MVASTQKGKKWNFLSPNESGGSVRRNWLSPNGNRGSVFKSPVKLMSPIVHTKTIHLDNWWLIWPEGGDGIAVGGKTVKRVGVGTYFYSTSIKERHDCSTLESSDGFIIFISGLINRSMTEKNGFPPQVYSYFLNGFPFNWEDFASQHVNSHMESRNGRHPFPSDSFQDMSFHQKQDFLLSNPRLYDEDAIREHQSNDLFEKLQLTATCSKVDLPRTNNVKELQEIGIPTCPRHNFNGVHTRRMTKMEEAARVKTRGRTKKTPL